MKSIVLYFLIIFFSSTTTIGQELSKNFSPFLDTNQVLTNINTAARLEFVNPDSCITLLSPLLQQSRQMGFNRGIGAALTHIGLANIAQGETDTALLNYTKAMPYILQSSYDRPLVALWYTGIGFPYLRKGNYALASTYYYKALQIIANNDLQNSAIACRLFLNLGDLWWMLMHYNYSKSYFQQSERIAVNRNDTAAMIAIYGNLGNLYYSLGKKKQSDAYLQKALMLAKAKHVIWAEQTLLANMGASLRDDGKPAAAIPYFEKAIALADDDHAYQHNLQSHYNLAFAYYENGNYPKAKEQLLHTIHMAEKYDMDKEEIGYAMKVMGGIYEKEKNYTSANIWLNKYINFTENIIEKIADSSITKLEENYHNSEKDKQIAENKLLLSRRELEIKNKNIWIVGISGTLILLGLLLFIAIRINSHKQYLKDMQIRNLKRDKELVYLRAMIEGEEKERTRLARELHDGIGGMLASAKMGLGAIKETNKDNHNAEALNDLMRLLNDTATEIRQTAHNLMPDVLIKNSLKDALLMYCTDINASGQLEIDLQFHGHLEEMSKSIELIFYRITQELIQNIIKHAQATQAVIQIIQDNDRLNLIVEDNGIGFEQTANNKGFGLQNLQFRVQALQGYISVTSPKGKGTSVYIEFDLEKLKSV